MTEPTDEPNNSLAAVLAVVIAVVVVIAAVAYLGLRNDDADAAPGTLKQAAPPAVTAAPTETAAPTDAPAQPTAAAPGAGTTTVGPCTYVSDGRASRPVTPPTEADLRTGPVTATLTTSAGVVTLKLDGAKAPCATASFVSLARQGFFDKTTCHRILTGGPGEGAIAQCGDPLGDGTGSPGYAYGEENLKGASYTRGTVAMAKGNAPGSTGAQFFLVTQDFPIPPEYTLLGTITGGLPALDKVIAGGIKPGTELQYGGGTPNTPLDIKTVTTSG